MSNAAEEIKYLNIDDLHHFKDHPFKLRDGEEKENLLNSIKTQGTIEPLIVRYSSANKYEVVSGHRRLEACRELGIKEVPVLIKDLSDKEAVLMMVDANLHRETLLPSEKAFAYKMKLEALSHQGERTDLTFGQSGTKLKSDELISEDESSRQVHRYVRLTCLIPELLKMVDEKKIAFTPAVELSYLTKEEQEILMDAMLLNDCTPSYSQAVRLKKLSQKDSLFYDDIYAVLMEDKPNQKEQIKFSGDDLRKFFPKSYSEKEIHDEILKLLEARQRKRERGAR